MKINDKQIYLFLFGLFLALSISLFYLQMFADYPITDIGLFVGLVLFLWGCQYAKNVHYEYALFAAGAIALAFTSSLQANFLNGQPLGYGLRGQRQYMVIWFLYFPLTAMIQRKKMKLEDIYTVIRIIGWLCLIIFTAQFIVGENHMFLNVGYNYRYGTLRLYTYTIFIDLMYIIALNKLIISKKVNFSIILDILASLAYMVIVYKGRKMLICYLVVFGLTLLTMRQKLTKKIVLIFVMVAIASSLITDEIIEAVISMFDRNGTSYTIRNSAAQYWFQIIREHILCGGGFVNHYYAPAYYMAHLQYYFLEDNGIIGFFYQYGLLGMAWNVFLFIKCYKDGMRIKKENGNCIVLLLLLFTIVGFRGGAWISYFQETFRMVFLVLVAQYGGQESINGESN